MNTNFGKNRGDASPNSRDTITCAQVEANLFAFIKGDLDLPQQTAFRTHLTTCAQCAQAVAEAQLLDSELQRAASQHLSPLSAEASLRIQTQVYKRMQRALFLYRTQNVVQMAGAFAVTAVSILLLFLFGSRWLQFVAAPQHTNEQVTSVAAVETGAASAAVVVEDMPLPQMVAPTTVPDQVEMLAKRPLPDYLKELVTITPGQSPDQVAAAIFAATFAGDQDRLQQLFTAMRTSREPTLRLWSHLYSQCVDQPDIPSLRYHVVPHNPQLIARVDVYHNNHYVGELKMRRLNGEWYVVFTSSPAITKCRMLH